MDILKQKETTDANNAYNSEKDNTELNITGGLENFETPAVARDTITGGNNQVYSVGGAALYKIRSNIVDWNMIKNFNQNPGNKMISGVNDILNLQQHIDDPKILCMIITEIYNLPDKTLIKALSKSLGITNPLLITFKKLYYVWHDLIKHTYKLLLKELDIPIEYTNLSDLVSTDLRSTYHSINSAQSLSLHRLVRLIEKYTHKGYCPLEPISRIRAIFKFPMNALVDALQELDSTHFLGTDFDQIGNEIIKIVDQIATEADRELPQISARSPLSFNASLDLSSDETDNDMKRLKQYTTQFIDMYKNVYPALKQKELQYIKIAKKISDICLIIENIFSTSLPTSRLPRV